MNQTRMKTADTISESEQVFVAFACVGYGMVWYVRTISYSMVSYDIHTIRTKSVHPLLHTYMYVLRSMGTTQTYHTYIKMYVRGNRTVWYKVGILSIYRIVSYMPSYVVCLDTMN